MRFSKHFERDRKHQPDRRDITIEMCERTKEEPMRTREQEDGRTVFWGHIPEASTEEKARYLRVVVEPDGETVWTAHFDRNFRKRVERGEITIKE
jgi:hypothetical protein